MSDNTSQWTDEHDAEVGRILCELIDLLSVRTALLASDDASPDEPHEQAVIEIITRWSEDETYFATDAIRDAFRRGVELGERGQ